MEALDLLLSPGCAKLAKKVKHSCEPPSHGSDCEDDSKAAETGGGRHVFEVAKIRFGNEAGGPSECGPDFFYALLRGLELCTLPHWRLLRCSHALGRTTSVKLCS